MKTPAEIAARYAEQFRHDTDPRVGDLHAEILKEMTEAIEADRAQRTDSTTLKKAYDRWSEVFEGEEYYTDEQERAAQLDLAEIYAMMHGADSFHESLLWKEAEALADLLSATGRHGLARALIEEWAALNEEDAEEYHRELSEWFLVLEKKERGNGD